MKGDLTGFRRYIEDDTRSLKGDKKKNHGAKPENLLDGMWRELGIDPNDVPKEIQSGPIEIDGIYYNQATWIVKKPIHPSDNFVTIYLDTSKSPTTLNQHAYVRKHDGSMEPYDGTPNADGHLISVDKFAELLGRPWQATVAQGQGGGAPPGGMPPM